jgi:hypothetical protein
MNPMAANEQLLVRLEKSQKQALARRAKEQGRTVAGHIRWLIEQDCGSATTLARAERKPAKRARRQASNKNEQ